MTIASIAHFFTRSVMFGAGLLLAAASALFTGFKVVEWFFGLSTMPENVQTTQSTAEAILRWLLGQDPNTVLWFAIAGLFLFGVFMVAWAIRRTQVIEPARPIRASAPIASETPTSTTRPEPKPLSGLPAQEAPLASAWGNEFNQLRYPRRRFWRIVRDSAPYHDAPAIIQDAPFLEGLLVAESERFTDWVWGNLVQQENKLWELACKFYPPGPKDRGHIYPINLIGPPFDDFDDIRAELAKFWDRWGRSPDLDAAIREQSARDLVASGENEIKFLTYLEAARAVWENSPGRGKVGLFRLSNWLRDS